MFDYWKKQGDEPLFPDLLWSRPENKALLPKVTIIGGSKQGFAKSAAIYQAAAGKGCGALKLVLPGNLKDSLPPNPDFIFIENTKTGSFSKKLYDNLKAGKANTDVFVVSEDSGRESETTQSIHKLLADDDCDLMFVGESILFSDTYFDELVNRKSFVSLVLRPMQLQKVASRLPTSVAFKSSDGVVDLVKGLHEITSELQTLLFVAETNGESVVAGQGKVYSTKIAADLEEISGYCAAYGTDNLAKNYIVALFKDLK